MATPWRSFSTALGPLVVTLLAAAPLSAQVRLAGVVLDEHNQPLPEVVVSVREQGLRSVTDLRGRFVLMLALGRASLLAQRLGYVPSERTVQINAATDTLVIHLHALPALLKGVTVDAPFGTPLSQTLTSQTVRQVPPLLEADVFRALTLLPGVSQPNDLRGRVHLAGGASDETAIRLDGHPLQDPFHLFGLLGAFNVGALEQASVQIHHVPLESAGHLSGAIDLETKAPGGHETEATLSLLTAGASVSRDLPAGFDLLVSARSSYLKAFADAIYSDAKLSRGDVPLYDARDGVVRIGRGHGQSRWEAIGFATHDGIEDGKLRGQPGYKPLAWGEGLLGLSGSVPLGSWVLTSHGSMNRAYIHTDERVPGTRGDFVDLRRDLVTLTSVARRAGRLSYALGTDWQRRTYAQSWSVSRANTDIFSPRTPNVYAGNSSVMRGGVFSSVTANLFTRASVTVGARTQVAPNLGFVAPQALASYRVTSRASLDVSVERRHQFDAELEEPVEGTVGAPRFLLSTPRIADVAGAALAWKGASPAASSELRAFVFAKVYRRDVRLVDTEIGGRVDVAPPSFPAFEPVRAFARGIGVMASTARESGVALQGSYTWTLSRDRLAGVWSPRDGDIPHTAVGFASVPVKWLGVDLTTALQLHSGAVISPVAARVFVPDERTYYGLLPRYLAGDRNSFRLPGYRRLDLGTRRTWHPSKVDLTLSIQVLNLLVQRNPRDVSWELYYDYLTNGDPNPMKRASSGLPGLPILPSLGLEVRW